ncbi:phage tail sheath family protein [Bradyrhizobium sp. S3.2.12]|uniref:phage tail sheath family protein n=1 Tax=Bradyrhizobium sp. S3.2.12 TaxID=3156387 RepID=UPI0033988000
MPEYLHPGVYIEEIERGPKPIEGVPTSTAAFIGETERGPTKPRLVTSYKDYQRWFGGVFGDTKFLPYAVSGFFENGGKRLYVCRVTDDIAVPAEAALGPNFTVRAVGAGTWGQRVYARVEESSTKKPGPNNGPAVPVGFKLRLAYYSTPPDKDPVEWFKNPGSPPFPNVAEVFDDLDADERSPNYWYKRLRDNSALAELSIKPGTPAGTIPPNLPSVPLGNGKDGNPVDAADFMGEVLAPRLAPQGLAALRLDPYREVALVYAPGAPLDVNKKVIDHCETLRFRFAVVDSDKSVDVTNSQPRSTIADSKYAALYYPWIAISDPQTGARKEVPPGGHVLGVYARTDSERGVFKAPANEILRGVLELTADIDDGTQDTLNPRGINAIRQFPERGIRVWGARTLTSDALWKYVSVRRLFIFLERSIYEGTQWVVFEPNDYRLWARVIDTIRLFLRTQWRLGALFGRTEEEAFFITCDRTTMTQDDILNGRLICEIGIAPVRPAEFVIFRIFQNTAEAQN